jgi:hypothetical protein
MAEFFTRLFGASRKSVAPLKSLDPRLYDALFADKPEQFKAHSGHPAIAWYFEGKTIDTAAIERIIADPDCESRLAYLACHCARQKGIAVPAKKLFGTIIEFPMDDKHDVLAVFADKRARYYNHSGRAVIIEANPSPAAPAMEKLLAVSQVVIGVIGPWDRPRPAPVAKGVARFSFLVSDGLYFGEGPPAVMSRDHMAAAVLGAGALAMKAMIAMAEAAPRAKSRG